jgi:hypothetical protein
MLFLSADLAKESLRWGNLSMFDPDDGCDVCVDEGSGLSWPRVLASCFNTGEPLRATFCRREVDDPLDGRMTRCSVVWLLAEGGGELDFSVDKDVSIVREKPSDLELRGGTFDFLLFGASCNMNSSVPPSSPGWAGRASMGSSRGLSRGVSGFDELVEL